MVKQLLSTTLILSAAAMPLMAGSSPEKAEEHTTRLQHGSHEHGVAALTVATTETGLEIVLESPAVNLFGFEHRAQSEEEHETATEVLEKLKDGAVLFSPDDAAGCSLDNTDIDASTIEQHDSEQHAKDDHADDKHSDHDHEGHTHEEHADDEEHRHAESAHSDITVTWVFACDKPENIRSVNTGLFSAFPEGFEHLTVEWLTANNAGKTVLEKDGSVELRQ